MDQIEPLARSMPYMTAIGNHVSCVRFAFLTVVLSFKS